MRDRGSEDDWGDRNAATADERFAVQHTVIVVERDVLDGIVSVTVYVVD